MRSRLCDQLQRNVLRAMRCLPPLLAAIALCAAIWSVPASAGGRQGIAVLVYHQVSAVGGLGNAETIPLDRFRAQMSYLATNGYQTLSVRDLVEVLKGEKRTSEKSVLITFDDAWRSALPALNIIEEMGFKASLFIPSGALQPGENMSWEDIQRLSRSPNFEFGSHSLTHPCHGGPNLVDWLEGRAPGKGIADVISELQQSKHAIETQLNRPVTFFAWPCGIFNPRLIELAQRGGLRSAADRLGRQECPRWRPLSHSSPERGRIMPDREFRAWLGERYAH
jgi:peptidoglycan/xylan/chitin deacetylase (PgdA/CDA1 family)